MPNTSRLATLSSSPMLKEYAQGAAQEAIQPVAEFLAPTVPVSTSVGRYKVYDEKHKFHIPNTLRGLGGEATQLSFDVSDQTYNCAPHALDFPVDNLEELEGSGLENTLQEGATLIAEIAGLSHEKAVIDAALTAVGSGTAYTWSGATPSDPVNDLDGAILTIIKAAKYGSLMGVGVLFGATAYQLFKNNLNVRARFTTNGGAGSTIPNVDTAAASSLLIGQPDVRVSYMVYDSAAEGKTATMNFVLDNAVLVFARKANPTRRDPSFAKTFRLTGNFMVPGSYMRPDGRAEICKFDWSEDIKIVNAPACTRLNPS